MASVPRVEIISRDDEEETCHPALETYPFTEIPDTFRKEIFLLCGLDPLNKKVSANTKLGILHNTFKDVPLDTKTGCETQEITVKSGEEKPEEDKNEEDKSEEDKKVKLTLAGIPAECRLIIYEWLFVDEDVVQIWPGRYRSDEFDPLIQRYLFRQTAAQSYEPPDVDFTSPGFLTDHNYALPIFAQTLPILSVCHKFRKEVAHLLFKDRLCFPRIYDFDRRISCCLTHLPPLFRDSIQKVSVEIASRTTFGTNYGNRIIPYLSLCPNLKVVELRFSLRFYRLIFHEKVTGDTPEQKREQKRDRISKVGASSCLVKLLIHLLNLRTKDLRITVGDAYKHGDEFVKNSFLTYGGDIEGRADEQEEISLDGDLPSEWRESEWWYRRPDPKTLPKILPEAYVPLEMVEKKRMFDKIITDVFAEAVRHRDHTLSACSVQELQSVRNQPVYQFWESDCDEKAVQMRSEIEQHLDLSPIRELARQSQIEELVHVEEILMQKTIGIYDAWLSSKYRIPTTTMDFRLAECELLWAQLVGIGLGRNLEEEEVNLDLPNEQTAEVDESWQMIELEQSES